MQLTPGLIAFMAVIGGAAAGWLAAYLSRPGLGFALSGLMLAIALGLSWHAQTLPGLDAIAPMAYALYIFAPAGCAAALGVLIETLRRRRALARGGRTQRPD